MTHLRAHTHTHTHTHACIHTYMYSESECELGCGTLAPSSDDHGGQLSFLQLSIIVGVAAVVVVVTVVLAIICSKWRIQQNKLTPRKKQSIATVVEQQTSNADTTVVDEQTSNADATVVDEKTSNTDPVGPHSRVTLKFCRVGVIAALEG